jgi:hypothetical protein
LKPEITTWPSGLSAGAAGPRPAGALGLAQHFVRVGVGLEHVRQRDEIHALRGERQLQRIGGHAGAGLEREREAVRDAVLSQEIDLG